MAHVRFRHTPLDRDIVNSIVERLNAANATADDDRSRSEDLYRKSLVATAVTRLKQQTDLIVYVVTPHIRVN